jgi:hypothetical protein
LIAGLLRKSEDSPSPVVYGSVDETKDIKVDGKFSELLVAGCKQLHLKEHAVLDANGNEVKLQVSPDCKASCGLHLFGINVFWLHETIGLLFCIGHCWCRRQTIPH